MHRRFVLALSLAAVVAVSVPPERHATAQAPASRAEAIADAIVGVWMLVSVTSEREGTRSQPFGPNPKGIMVFTRDGHFSLFQSTAELPRLAANDRARATPDEATTIIRDSIAYFGTYTVDEAARSLSVTIEASTYANLLGPPQRRIITVLSPTDLEFSNPRTPSGMTLHTVWRRAPSR